MNDLKALLLALDSEWPASSISITDLKRFITKAITIKEKESKEQECYLNDALNDAMSDDHYGSGD